MPHSKRTGADSNQDTVDAGLLQSLAATHFLFGQYAKSMKLLKLAHFIDGGSVRTIESMAVVAIRMGEIEQGLQHIASLTSRGLAPSADVTHLFKLATRQGVGNLEVAPHNVRRRPT